MIKLLYMKLSNSLSVLLEGFQGLQTLQNPEKQTCHDIFSLGCLCWISKCYIILFGLEPGIIPCQYDLLLQLY